MNNDFEFSPEFNDALLEFKKGLESFAKNLSVAVAMWLEEARPAMFSFWEAVYQTYLDHGAIYGETQEGCLRWLQELGEIQRLRAEANYLEQRQQAVADFKQLVAERRAVQ